MSAAGRFRGVRGAPRVLRAARPTATTWDGETNIMSDSMKTPLASMLSQVYGKPVQLNLTLLGKPHLNANILAKVATQHMASVRNSAKGVQRDLVTKVGLPGVQDVLNTAAKQRLLVNALRRKPSLATMDTPRTPIRDILHDLNLKRVSHIGMRIAGRYGRRLSADMATSRVAHQGLTTSGPGTMLRQVRKGHVTYALRAGKRKVGAYGIKVWLGHS